LAVLRAAYSGAEFGSIRINSESGVGSAERRIIAARHVQVHGFRPIGPHVIGSECDGPVGGLRFSNGKRGMIFKWSRRAAILVVLALGAAFAIVAIRSPWEPVLRAAGWALVVNDPIVSAGAIIPH